jgi:hypothetical protein
VAIVGGDSESCFLALYIAGRGADVHVIEPDAQVSLDKDAPARDILIGMLEALPTVHLHKESTAEEIGDGYVVVQHAGELRRLENVESVVFGGRIADNALYEELAASEPAFELYNIGDSTLPHDILQASHEAAEVADVIRYKAGLAVEAAAPVAAGA